MTLIYEAQDLEASHIHALVIGVEHYSNGDYLKGYKLGQLTSPVISAKKFTCQ